MPAALGLPASLPRSSGTKQPNVSQFVQLTVDLSSSHAALADHRFDPERPLATGYNRPKANGYAGLSRPPL